MTQSISRPIALPCGMELPNRLVKAAMSEGLADAHNQATDRLATLYRRWAGSGAGLLLSGNFQVDRKHLERPGNLVVDDDTDVELLKRVAEAGLLKGGHFWAQLGHTGRQVASAINRAPLAPSSVEMEVPAMLGRSYAKPVAMTEDEIEHVIAQFATAARLVKRAGFTGVHVHGAHGYLISQFLSARSNIRTDGWGGSLENRARFLLATITAIRAAVGPGFPIGLKLNSSDFMKGGFTKADAIKVVGWLNGTGLDLLELSGGSVEQPKIVGLTFQDEGEDGRAQSTIRREAYFVEFAAEIRKTARMPVMVTGGFRSTKAMDGAIDAGEVDLIGLGRPFCADPEIAGKLLSGLERAWSPDDGMPPFYVLPWCNMQIERMASGQEPELALGGEEALEQFKAIEGGYLQAWLTRDSLRGASAVRT